MRISGSMNFTAMRRNTFAEFPRRRAPFLSHVLTDIGGLSILHAQRVVQHQVQYSFPNVHVDAGSKRAIACPTFVYGLDS